MPDSTKTQERYELVTAELDRICGALHDLVSIEKKTSQLVIKESWIGKLSEEGRKAAEIELADLMSKLSNSISQNEVSSLWMIGTLSHMLQLTIAYSTAFPQSEKTELLRQVACMEAHIRVIAGADPAPLAEDALARF